MVDKRDPVERAANRSMDLYDIATWEERTSLDGLSVAVYRLIVTLSRVLVVLLALGILVAIGGLTIFTNPQVGILTALSVIPAFGLVAYVWYSDVTSSEPLFLLVATFLLGVLMANFAAVINTVMQQFLVGLLGSLIGSIVLYYLIVGPTEETVKMLAVRLYAYRSESFDAVIDGVVYGAVAGLGFATIENSLYIARSLQQSGSTSLGLGIIGAGGGIAAVRALAGPGHVIYSGFAGYYLGLAKFNRENAGPIVVKGIIIAAFIHATYDTTVGVGSTVIAGITGLPDLYAFLAYVIIYDSFFAFLLFRKIRRYRRAYRDVDAGHQGREVRPEPTEFE